MARSPAQPIRARWVAAGGAVLALLVLAALLALAWHERGQEIDNRRDRSELMVRVLEDHATRSLDTAALALSTLADLLAKEPPGRNTQIGALLSQTLVGLPLLRSVAVLDASGRVLASTVPSELGVQVDLRRLGPMPTAGRDSLGRFLPGRGLQALAVGDGARAVAPRGVGFIPMLRRVDGTDGGTLLLLGLLNPDFLANQQQQTLDDTSGIALLADYNGRVLAATTAAPLLPGAQIQGLSVFTQLLPDTEHASLVGPGLGEGRRILAYRALRARPLVALVEFPERIALARWWDNARWLAMVGAAAMLVIGAMTWVAARSVRLRESARRQRDHAQHAVAQRERELSVLVKSVQELIFRTDAHGTLTFVNARWQAATGQPPGLLLGRPLADLVADSARAETRALFAPGEHGTRSAHVLIGGQGGGQPRHFDVAVAPLLDGPLVVGFAGSAVDVTERWAAQRQLQEQLAFSALLLDTIPLPVSLLDREGRYVTVNQAWEEFTRRRRADVTGRRARDYLPPDEAALHDAKDAELLARGGRVRYDAELTHPDGSRRTLALTKAAVPGADGTPDGVLVTFLDVSEFREAERATRDARDAAEEASRAKSEFIANISHELRTPLQSIIGFSELGMHRGREQPKLAAMFTDIHASGQRMLALVNDLLDVAKIESTVGTFHLERTDLRPLVRDVVRELEPLLVARRLHIEPELGDLPLVAKVDPLRFQQVVRNVVANAVKFSPAGATIEVCGDLDAHQQVVLTVRDHGPGIPPAELESIFEAFVQSSKTKDGSGGTGLGLAICRKIVEAHGGTIQAENADGGGSRFTIALPVRAFSETVV